MKFSVRPIDWPLSNKSFAKFDLLLPLCTRNNVYKYNICCHNNIITKKFIFLTRDFS